MSEYPDLQALEAEWEARCPEGACRERLYGWQPYPEGDFCRLLDVAVSRAARRSFLEVGCGIGTKSLIARRRHGLDVVGIELFPEYANQAALNRVPVWQGDMQYFTSYREFGIVYVNCPYKIDALEHAWERWLQDRLVPGQVLIQVNDCCPPEDWETVLDERDCWRGVWVKR